MLVICGSLFAVYLSEKAGIPVLPKTRPKRAVLTAKAGCFFAGWGERVMERTEINAAHYYLLG